MAERKVIIEVVINDDSVSSIKDMERAILAQDIYGQVAKKYLDSLQDDMIAQVDERKGSKKVQIKTHQFEFGFQAKRTLDDTGKKRL